jgi:hypothetical protein
MMRKFNFIFIILYLINYLTHGLYIDEEALIKNNPMIYLSILLIKAVRGRLSFSVLPFLPALPFSFPPPRKSHSHSHVHPTPS